MPVSVGAAHQVGAVQGFVNLCYAGYCHLEYFTGVAVCLLGMQWFLAFFTGLSTMLTD